MPAKKKQDTQMSKEEQIGFHKGSLATLSKEREEMLKILSIVETLMKAHLAELKKLGVDLGADPTTAAVAPAKKKEKKEIKPIDELLE